MLRENFKMKLKALFLLILINLTACGVKDDSIYIVDDLGYVHKTIHYTDDKRGREYYPTQIPATGFKQFVFDPRAYAWAAYDENGKRLITGAASGGKDICEEDGKNCRTVTGTFNVYNKKGLECRSGEYPVETKGGTKMPYCMYFYQGYTIHAAFEVPFDNVSHGCIRVWPSAAKWLNEHFIDVGTRVVVMSYADEDEINSTKS
jgi:hypothetical protein